MSQHIWQKIYTNPDNTTHYMDITQIGDATQLTIHVGPGNADVPQLYFLRMTEIQYDHKCRPICVDVLKPQTFFARSDHNAHRIALSKLKAWAGEQTDLRYKQLERLF